MPPIAKSTRFRRVVPYTIVDGIEGRGQFVGVTLATGMNGNNTCWVEGEARMYLDDDPYPSIHYTGTEDYFRRFLWIWK